jgi:hypothetical protein
LLAFDPARRIVPLLVRDSCHDDRCPANRKPAAAPRLAQLAHTHSQLWSTYRISIHFVLSLAQQGAGDVSGTVEAIAVLGATSLNNLLQAIYAKAYSAGHIGSVPVAALGLMVARGIGMAALS